MPGPPSADELPNWAQRVIIWGSTGYATASITASSIALGALAWDAGYHDPRCVLFGAAFEVAALVTGTAWAASVEGSWWHHLGKRSTLGLFAASLLFNGAEVLQVRGYLPSEALLVIAVLVSFVFPLLSLLFGHLGLVAKRAMTPAPTAGPPVEHISLPDVPPADAFTIPPAGGDVHGDEPTGVNAVNGAGPEEHDVDDVDEHHLDEHDTDDPVADVERFIITAREEGRPYGQRPAAEALGIPRNRIAELHRQALARLDAQPATNGARVPLPTAGA